MRDLSETTISDADSGGDRLARRQSIINGFKTPHQFAERIMQLEDECRAICRQLMARAAAPLPKTVIQAICTVAMVVLTFSIANAATIVVPAGGNLQNAVNSAQLGDTVIIQAGAAYSNLVLPAKTGSAYLTIQSSRVAEIPVGVRVSPAQSALFAKIQSVVTAEPVIKTAPGAHHYRFIGVDIATAAPSLVVYDLVRFGAGRDEQKTLDSVPHDLIIDRSWIHGWDTQDVQRGISLNSAETTISNSYISDVHGVGFDTQAAGGWNGPGPFHILNNYLEAAGENIMFGGSDPASEALMPANIRIIGNYLFKPLSWKVGDPTYAGKHWTVKNLLELKNAKNVQIIGNVMENNWTDAQSGVPVLFTVRNQDCSAPYSTVQNVTYISNTVKNAEGGLNFLGKDNEADLSFGKCKNSATAGSVRGSDVLIGNSLFYNIKGPFLTLNGFNNVTLDRNTHVQAGNFMTLYGEQSQGLKLTNGLTIDHDYGIFGDGGTSGVAALDKYAPGWVMTGYVVANPYNKTAYPANNDYPATITIPADFKSPIPGKGADIDALNAAQSGGSQPTPTPTPTPPPSPSATPTPTPQPSPTPSPSPSPECVMVVSAPVLDQWDTGVLRVTVQKSPPSAFSLQVVTTSGQISVSPGIMNFNASSVVAEFQLASKKKSSSVIVNGPCGSQTVLVTVR